MVEPAFLDNDANIAVAINGKTYRNMLQKSFGRYGFQRPVVPTGWCYTAGEIMTFLAKNITQRLISKWSEVCWPVKCCDLILSIGIHEKERPMSRRLIHQNWKRIPVHNQSIVCKGVIENYAKRTRSRSISIGFHLTDISFHFHLFSH